MQKPKLGDTTFLEDIGEYSLHLGIPQNGINQIIEYSLDESDIALREGTSDWKKRFISIRNLTSWYNDMDRYPFTLLSKEDSTVVGLWWGRPAKIPHISKIINNSLYQKLQKNSENVHTSGIRIYPLARGQKLAQPFLKACSKHYEKLFKNIHMSIDIDEKNIASQKSFEKAGFEQVGYGKNVNNSPESGKKRFVYLRISAEDIK